MYSRCSNILDGYKKVLKSYPSTGTKVKNRPICAEFQVKNHKYEPHVQCNLIIK